MDWPGIRSTALLADRAYEGVEMGASAADPPWDVADVRWPRIVDLLGDALPPLRSGAFIDSRRPY
ncbi:MAG: hypothetical protein OXD50_04160 [Chloroflexi bacterium]|nr:hypothetical protein [Chloroflexota bacterium]